MRGSRLSGWRALVLASAVAFPRLADAASTDARPRVQVHWTGPQSCGPGPLSESLDALLAESEVDARVEVDATVVEEADGWRVDAWFRVAPDRDGRRTFRAPACATVSHAAALAIAIAVDPTVLDRVEGEGEPVDAPAVQEPSVVEPPTPEPDVPAPAATDPVPLVEEIVAIEPASSADVAPSPWNEGWRAVIGAGARIDGVALPGPGLGGELGVGVLHRRFRADLIGSLRAPTRRAAPDRDAAGGRFHQWALGARGCFVPRLGPVELPLCAGAEGGQVIGRGYGWPRSQVARMPWLAGTGTVGVAVPLGARLAVVGQGGVAVPLLRPEFAVQGVGTVAAVGPVQVRGLLGLELRLP